MLNHIALCVIVKNENPEFAEWLIHHHLVGFDTIIVYNNMSDDGTTELINLVAQSIDIRHIRWEETTVEMQNLAYDHCMKNYGRDFEWIAFFDADEFLISKSNENIHDLIARHIGSAAVVVNWVMFGSSSLQEIENRLVMEAFTLRAPDSFGPNHHIKSICRPSAYLSTVNAHYFKLTGDYCHQDGALVVWNANIKGVTSEIRHGDWRLHHYFVRSATQWAKRMIRRQADATVRDEETRKSHDRNDIRDETAFFAAQSVKWFMGESGLATALTWIKPTPPDVRLDEMNAIVVRGWTMYPDRAASSIALVALVDGEIFKTFACSDTRSDVKKSGHHADNVGFRFSLPLCFLDGKEHRLQFRDDKGSVARIITPEATDDHVTFSYLWDSKPDPGLVEDWVQKEIERHPTHDCEIKLYLDEVTSKSMRGWAFRRLDPLALVSLTACIDGDEVMSFVCSDKREDVKASGFPSAQVGFSLQLPSKFFDGRAHRLSFKAETSDRILIFGASEPSEVREFSSSSTNTTLNA